MMKIRLLIPLCQNTINKYFCQDSLNIYKRIHLLKKVISKTPHTDLIITSHNFFFLGNLKSLINKLNRKLNKKIPIILGIDLKNKSKSFNKNGYVSIVVFLNVNKNNYYFQTLIKECWYAPSKCNQKCFRVQNQARIVKFKNKTLMLFSCGDIDKNCHNYNLQKHNISINLSHMSLRGHSPQFKQPKILLKKKLTTLSICTQQLKNQQTLNNYISKQNYCWVFSNSSVNQKVKKINQNVLVDIEVK